MQEYDYISGTEYKPTYETLKRQLEHNKSLSPCYRQGLKEGLDAGYTKGIEEFAEQLKNKLVFKYGNASAPQQYVAMQVTDWCNEIVEKLNQ